MLAYLYKCYDDVFIVIFEPVFVFAFMIILTVTHRLVIIIIIIRIIFRVNVGNVSTDYNKIN